MAYGKIFESMFTGSMVGSGLSVFAVWSYVIANTKPPGTIELNPKIMATVFGCSVEEVVTAIGKLMDPDPDSRSKEHDGRRLIHEGDFLYFVPTWEKYNKIRNEIERREQNREAQRRWRERNRKQVSAYVSTGSLTSAESAHADADADADNQSTAADAAMPVTKRRVRATLTTEQQPLFEAFWDCYDFKVARKDAEVEWMKIRPSAKEAEAITLAAIAYRKAHPGPGHVKYPAGWLKGRRWNDASTDTTSYAGTSR